jgi:hypothetical protein
MHDSTDTNSEKRLINGSGVSDLVLTRRANAAAGANLRRALHDSSVLVHGTGHVADQRR